MSKTSPTRRTLVQNLLLVLLGFTAVDGAMARFILLGWPAKQIFDEVYFPVFANDYLQRMSFFDVHPPFGKFLIAIPIAIFGNAEFAWRLMPAILGFLIPLLAAWGWYRYQKDRVGAVIIAILLFLEPILIVYSRTGLLDGMQLFFILACFALAANLTRRKQVISLAIMLGLAVSIKWIALAIIVPVAYMAWRKGFLKEFIISLPISVAIYLGMVFAGQYLINVANPWQGVTLWHHQAYDYQVSLKATHPWSSMWWTWPFMIRPVLFLYDIDASGFIHMMTALGNPIIWWASTSAVLLSLVEVVFVAFSKEGKKVLDHPLMPLLVGYCAFYLPWIPIHRVVFIYHYLPSYAFALFMLTYWLRRLWIRYPWLVFVYLLIAVGFGVYYLPLATGLPQTQAGLDAHLWIKSWL